MTRSAIKKRLMGIMLLSSVLALSIISTSRSFQPPSNIISTKGMVIYWPHVYVTVNASKVIGINNLSLGFMLDWEWKIWRDRTVLKQLAKDANFRLIRVFSHRIEPCTNWDESTRTGTFDWTNVDSIIREIFGIGAEPLICIGFCDSNGIIIPPGMAINATTGLPYPESFAAYCAEWVKHFEQIQLPVKYYEVFNEPFFYFYKNWVYNETKLGYFLNLFNKCYDEMHKVNPEILIGNDASLYRKFLDYWKTHGGKLDFFSFHKYDCDNLNMEDEIPLKRAERRYFVTDSIFYGIRDARQLLGANLPAIASECNWAATCASGTDPRIQKVVGATWLALVLRTAVLEGAQYVTYYCFSSSKSWEVANKPSGGFGFGMINHDDNQPWYPYYVQKLIGTSLYPNDLLVESTTSSNDIKVLSWIHESKINLLLICKINETRVVTFHGLTGQLDFFRIDGNVSYLTPQVQTGQIDADAPFILDGYSVVLLTTTIM